MKHFLILSISLLSISNLQAQGDNCKVELDAIKGTYTGACLDGKANGQGKSTGIDEFEGEFKNGYPEGSGRYTWQNKNYYVGSWKKGRMDGNGEMHVMTANGDSTIKGFWKKDKYVGRYEKQYVVIASTSRINKVNCSLSNKKGESLNITVHQMSSSTTLVSNGGLASISNIVPIIGNFQTKNTQSMSNNSLTRLTQVTFPFRAIFYIGNENTEILFNEKGDYEVYIDIQ